MALKKVRKAFLSLSFSSLLIPTVGTVARSRLRLSAPAALPCSDPQGCRSLSLAGTAPFRGRERHASCHGWLPQCLNWSWRSVTLGGDRPWGLRAVCQCVASSPAAHWGCWHVMASFGRAWWGAGSSSPGFGLLPSPSGFAAAVGSKSKPKCSTKGHQAQRPPVCCRLSQPDSGTALAAIVHHLPAGRLPKCPPPLPSLGCASPGMPRTGLSWDGSWGVALPMVGALRAPGCHIFWGDGGFGSGCNSLVCRLLSNDCCVVLLSSLMKLWALRAGMGNYVFKMGLGETMSFLGEFATLPTAPGPVSVSSPEFHKMHTTQTQTLCNVGESVCLKKMFCFQS